MAVVCAQSRSLHVLFYSFSYQILYSMCCYGMVCACAAVSNNKSLQLTLSYLLRFVFVLSHADSCSVTSGGLSGRRKNHRQYVVIILLQAGFVVRRQCSLIGVTTLLVFSKSFTLTWSRNIEIARCGTGQCHFLWIPS